MTIAHIGDLGTALSSGNNQSSLVLTTTADAEAGNLVVLLVAVDNNQTTDGDSTAVSGITDSAGGNTWTRGKEFANGQGANQAGADVSIWFSVLDNTIPSGGTITATFTNATTSDASAMTAKEFSVAAGAGVQIEGTPGGLADDAADPGSLDVTTANRECLRVRAIASESNSATALTVTAGGWAAFAQAVSGAGTSATEMGIRGEWIISTGTGAASNPTAFSADHASAYVAFVEGATPGVGDTDGAGAAVAVGAAFVAGAAAAAAAGAANGVGSSTASAVGLATGAASEAGAGSEIVSGVGAATAATDGAASGTGIVSGVGTAVGSSEPSTIIESADGAAAGAGSANAEGIAFHDAIASAIASGAAAASGASTAETVGIATAAAAAAGVGSFMKLITVVPTRQAYPVPLSVQGRRFGVKGP